MPHHLAAPYGGHHGEDRFHCHPRVPLSPWAALDVGRVAPCSSQGQAFGAMKAGVGRDDHLAVIAFQRVSEGLVVDVGRSAVPISDQAQLVERYPEIAPNDPAVIGLALPADLARPSTLARRMAQFSAVAVGDAQGGGLGKVVL